MRQMPVDSRAESGGYSQSIALKIEMNDGAGVATIDDRGTELISKGLAML